LRLAVTLVLPAAVLAYLSADPELRDPVFDASVLLVIGIGVAYGLGQDWVRRIGSAPIRWGIVAALGLAAVVLSAAMYERQLNGEVDRYMEEMESTLSKPPMHQTDQLLAMTDHGTRIPLLEPISPRSQAEADALEVRALRGTFDRQIIRRQPASDHCNCHGWVFTGGKFAIASEMVDAILSENDYRPVDHPLPGDLAIYGRSGYRTHTAIVRYVTPDMPVLVEGKWGSGSVYLHSVEQYGALDAFYRSPRGGHLLAGCGGPSAPPPSDKMTMDELTE
jgi:hypothetical protein